MSKSKAEQILKILSAVERLERPDVSKTRVSRESDKDIDALEAALATFITLWLVRGYFTLSEEERLSALFRKHAEMQYLRGQRYTDDKTGEQKPLTKQDIDKIEEMARKAKQDFITNLQRESVKRTEEKALNNRLVDIAAIIATGLGILALNQGTLSHARYVQFVSRRDLRVCPICETLDGNVYKVDERTGIIEDGPVIPIHPMCRCRYLTLEDDGEE